MGAYTGTGGTLEVWGGAAGANGLLDISGAALGTVTGNHQLYATNVGSGGGGMGPGAGSRRSQGTA